MSVGKGVGVLVGGGRGVLVGGGLGVLVGGTRVTVALGRRVLVGGTRVEVGRGDEVKVGEAVSVKKSVGVESIFTDTAWTVSAETVLRLSMAISTMLAGSRTMGLAGSGLEIAIADVIHNRLMPRTPAATTPSRLV